jgi:hypothetical protein
LYFSIWAFLTTALVVVVVSYCTRPEPEEKIAGLIYWRIRKKP